MDGRTCPSHDTQEWLFESFDVIAVPFSIADLKIDELKKRSSYLRVSSMP